MVREVKKRANKNWEKGLYKIRHKNTFINIFWKNMGEVRKGGSQMSCSECGGDDHKWTECRNENKKCLNCGGPHRTLAMACPVKKEKIREKRQAEVKDNVK